MSTAVDVDEEPRLARARANAIGWAPTSAGRPRRSRARIVGAVVLMVVSGWLGAALFLSAGSRDDVLVVREGVERFTELSADDVAVARVASDADVATVPADRLEELVGRVTAIDIAAGSLLGEDQLLDEGERAVGPGEAVVGALLDQADSPGELPRGVVVRVIVRADATSGTAARTLEGWVLDVEEASNAVAGPSARWVSLVVADADSGEVSAAAAEDRVTVVVLGGR